MRTIKEGTRAEKAFRFIEPATKANIDYYLWPGGVVPDEGGAGASNQNPKPIRYYIDFGRVFCAWVPNMMLRSVGKRVPKAQFQSNLYDGGIAAYWGSSSFPQIGSGYFAGYMASFDLETAMKWAYDDRIPVLCGWRYVNASSTSQGHVFQIFPSGWILESAFGAGLRWIRPGDSPLVRYATVMVRGHNWIEYSGDRF